MTKEVQEYGIGRKEPAALIVMSAVRGRYLNDMT
jgi:hypothetical protein